MSQHRGQQPVTCSKWAAEGTPDELCNPAKDVSKEGVESATWSLLTADSKVQAEREELRQQIPSDSPHGALAMSGDIFGHETGEAAIGIQLIEARDAGKYRLLRTTDPSHYLPPHKDSFCPEYQQC